MSSAPAIDNTRRQIRASRQLGREADSRTGRDIQQRLYLALKQQHEELRAKGVPIGELPVFSPTSSPADLENAQRHITAIAQKYQAAKPGATAAAATTAPAAKVAAKPTPAPYEGPGAGFVKGITDTVGKFAPVTAAPVTATAPAAGANGITTTPDGRHEYDITHQDGTKTKGQTTVPAARMESEKLGADFAGLSPAQKAQRITQYDPYPKARGEVIGAPSANMFGVKGLHGTGTVAGVPNTQVMTGDGNDLGGSSLVDAGGNVTGRTIGGGKYGPGGSSRFTPAPYAGGNPAPAAGSQVADIATGGASQGALKALIGSGSVTANGSQLSPTTGVNPPAQPTQPTKSSIVNDQPGSAQSLSSTVAKPMAATSPVAANATAPTQAAISVGTGGYADLPPVGSELALPPAQQIARARSASVAAAAQTQETANAAAADQAQKQKDSQDLQDAAELRARARNGGIAPKVPMFPQGY